MVQKALELLFLGVGATAQLFLHNKLLKMVFRSSAAVQPHTQTTKDRKEKPVIFALGAVIILAPHHINDHDNCMLEQLIYIYIYYLLRVVVSGSV